MGLLSSILNQKLPHGRAPSDDYWYFPLMGEVKSGARVNEFTALNYSAVYLAIMFISQTVASLPFHLFKQLPRGREKATYHPLYDVIHRFPNEYMTKSTFWETIIGHIVSWGNGYAEKQFSRGMGVSGLWPIPPNRCQPAIRDNKLAYDIRVDEGEIITLPRERILHIPGFGFDGFKGYSVVTLARECIGLGLAAEEFGARFFGHGAHPGMVVTHPLTMGPDAHQKLQRSLGEKYEGLGHAHRMMLLDEGMSVEKIGISQADAQFLETRGFQVDEVARWFNLPPHILKDLQYGSYNNVETLGQELIKYSLRPWMVRVEEHCDLQLLNPQSRKNLTHKWNAEGLLRGDTAARSEYYKSMWNTGAFSINDIREKEDKNPIDGGDTHFVPLNTTTVERAIQGENINEAKKQAAGAEQKPV